MKLICRVCREKKAESEFYIDKARKKRGGRSDKCKACAKQYASTRYFNSHGHRHSIAADMGTPKAWEIVMDYHNGLTVYAICNKHHVTSVMVYRLIDALGLPRRRKKETV